MSTTTSIRFSTRPKFPEDSELPILLSTLGQPVAPNESNEERKKRYTEYWTDKGDNLGIYGFNPKYVHARGDD